MKKAIVEFKRDRAVSDAGLRSKTKKLEEEYKNKKQESSEESSDANIEEMQSKTKNMID